MSDYGEDASTVGGERDSSVAPGIALDAASTRAVLSAKGVVGVVDAKDSGRASAETASLRANTSDGNVGSAAGNDSGNPTSHRLDMPDREVLLTTQKEV